MIKTALQKIMALPVMYDWMQNFFGLQKKKRILRDILKFNNDACVVLDVVGGTGLYQDFWPADYKYICLDFDIVKLSGFKGKNPEGYALCADAAQLSLKSNSVEYVFCSSLSHHISEDLLEKMISEMSRVVKPGDTLIFIDAVLISKSRLNRFLWSLDRGEHPHTYSVLENLIHKYFIIETSRKFSIYYDYILIIAKKF